MSALPAIPLDRANYPQLYHAARAALFRCEQIDECQEWASKSAAIASYAKQANDATLEEISKRIRARAVRRMGEILEKIPHDVGARTEERRANSRGGVARAAGLTANQQSAAIQVARVPRAQFEQRVEATPPATLAQLSQLGKKRRNGRDIKQRLMALRVSRFAAWCNRLPVDASIRRAANAADVRSVLTWCKTFLEVT